MIGAVMSHPARVQILIAMNTPRRRLSPNQFAQETGYSLRKASYHFKALEKAGCIALVEIQERRGMTRHIYEPLERALAWTTEWEQLPEPVKTGILKSVFGGAVAALGSAIDSGAFEAREESHLSWKTIQVDDQAWRDFRIILDRALRAVLKIEKQCSSRIEDGGSSFLMSYLLSTFESPHKPDPFESEPIIAIEPGTTWPTKDGARLRRRASKKDRSEAEMMAKAMAHPTRIRILMSMNSPRRRLSPKVFAQESGMDVMHCSYHFRELEDCGSIRRVAKIKRRGVWEYVFEACQTALFWTDDWRRLGPAIRQTAVATIMRGAVEALGEAIESGTFQERSDSYLAWSTIRVDEKGWQQIHNVYNNALDDLLELDADAAQRIASGSTRFSGSFFLATFESQDGSEGH